MPRMKQAMRVTGGPKKAVRQANMLTPAEFAEHMGVSLTRVRKWVQRGHVTVMQFGPDKRPFYLIAKSEADEVRHLVS